MATERNYFKESFYSEDYNQLHLPFFWIEEDPRNWTAINYLTRLIQSDPSTDKRIGNFKLSEDSKLVLKHAVSGSFAYTAINVLIKNKESARGKAAIKHLWDRSDNVSKSQIDYNLEKLQFRSLIAAEVNNDHNQILGKRLRTPESESEKEHEEELATSSSVEENASENIWHEWQKFLDDPLRRNLYESLSPEKNNVIWCCKSVARRSSLPESLYARLQVEVESVPAVAINHCLHKIVDRVLDADDLEQYEDAIEELRIQKKQSKENKSQIAFLIQILERLKDIYEDD
ncbi:hypothetical protein G6F43_013197 [Rhizopus delemar]|nr:hypothetical protein G6F43_013197 [Rhizopus delemar]